MLRHVLNARDVKVPGVWKFKPFTNLRGHLAQRPDVSEDVSVFRLRLEVELNEPLAILGFGELLVRRQKSSQDGQEAIKRSTRFIDTFFA